MTRSTKKLYGPGSGTMIAFSDRDGTVSEIFKKLGFAFGSDTLQSKMGKLLSVIVNDAIDYIIKEYPNVPDGAVVEVVSARLLKMEVKEKLQKVVDIYHDGQQEMLKEMSVGKTADKWGRIAELERAERESKDDEEIEEFEEALEEEPIESDMIEPVGSDIELNVKEIPDRDLLPPSVTNPPVTPPPVDKQQEDMSDIDFSTPKKKFRLAPTR